MTDLRGNGGRPCRQAQGPSLLANARSVVARSGWAGLYKGNAVNMMHSAPQKALSFFAFDLFKVRACLLPALAPCVRLVPALSACISSTAELLTVTTSLLWLGAKERCARCAAVGMPYRKGRPACAGAFLLWQCTGSERTTWVAAVWNSCLTAWAAPPVRGLLLWPCAGSERNLVAAARQ